MEVDLRIFVVDPKLNRTQMVTDSISFFQASANDDGTLL
jgi:hypothetical protein